MKYSDYERAFSPARLNKYLIACDEDKSKALLLYRYNIKLCQKFYGILNVFEIVLRNAINTHYQTHSGDRDWIKNQILDGGMLERCPQRQEIQNTTQMLIRQGKYSNDRLVSSVTFGFWTYLFNRVPFRLGGSNLLHIFPQRTPGLAQRPIYNELQQIKAFRNRIAHHEAICFNMQGELSMTYANENLSLIKKYIIFLGYDPEELYRGMDIKPYDLIDQISTML